MINDIKQYEIIRNFKFNVILNLLEGGFFGLALSISSYQTILPLFISNYTDSAILIGLIPAIHLAGWQLPQVFLANHVSRQKRFKPMIVALTIHERIPYLGLALAAYFLPSIGKQITLVFVFLLLIWQGLGAGVTAIAWQSLMGKIILPNRWGTFFGMQGSIFNLFGAAGAIIAGFILEHNESQLGFIYCFLITFVIMIASWIFLIFIREPESQPRKEVSSPSEFRTDLIRILAKDKNFRWFLVGRMLTSFAIMGFAFYTVYAVKVKGVSELNVGVMTSILFGIQILINPIMGWMGDRWNRRMVMILGLTAALVSSILAFLAPSGNWFYFVFLLAGIANTASWGIGITMTFDFSNEIDRPVYIGLANTLIAPANILAPFLGGWLADLAGYQATFFASALGGLAALLVFQFFVTDPKKQLGNVIQTITGPEHA